mmetsp:Transcript_57831/g.136257  ORF Transcript_57831/g.136257 Transcript_57831/m.136257 type:complete len:237 (-) Transcript_57831:41-751(-)
MQYTSVFFILVFSSVAVCSPPPSPPPGPPPPPPPGPPPPSRYCPDGSWTFPTPWEQTSHMVVHGGVPPQCSINVCGRDTGAPFSGVKRDFYVTTAGPIHDILIVEKLGNCALSDVGETTFHVHCWDDGGFFSGGDVFFALEMNYTGANVSTATPEANCATVTTKFSEEEEASCAPIGGKCNATTPCCPDVCTRPSCQAGMCLESYCRSTGSECRLDCVCCSRSCFFDRGQSDGRCR